MAVKTTTTYACDGCGKKQTSAAALRRFILTERKIDAAREIVAEANAAALRRFILTERKIDAAREIVAEAKTDLCTDCEAQLHKDALPLWPEKEAEKLAGIVRG